MSKEKYFLVGVKFPKDDSDHVQDSMEELVGLVKTAGGDVVGSMIQNRQSPDPATYIGKGKLQEIDLLFDKQEGALVFNAELSPSQVRNIEEEIECRVITRTELILDIFAIHAQSRISKLQIETAQLSYMLPRLVGMGSALSRTGGGIGTRGPGETKLETDRRKIRNRLTLLKKELAQLEKSSSERRKSRENVFKVAVAGYTNVGKSSLSTRLTRESLHAEDALFATVDTTTRKLALGGIEAVLTDTVGFIRDIPHALVESFKSTLSETAVADLILHVADPSSFLFSEKMNTALELMEELEISSPVVLIFNKIDLLTAEQLVQLKIDYPDAFFVSAHEEFGLDKLRKFLKEQALLFYKKHGKSLSEWMNFNTRDTEI